MLLWDMHAGSVQLLEEGYPCSPLPVSVFFNNLIINIFYYFFFLFFIIN